MLTQAFSLRRGVLSLALGAAAITAVAISRIVLRSERELARVANVVPYVAVGVIVALAARWIVARRLRAIELAIVGLVASASIATLALPRATFWAYALLPYIVLGGTFAIARYFADSSIVRWALAITGAFVAASVLLDAFAHVGVSAMRRPGGLLGNRNFAGEYLALALPAALVLFTRARRWLFVLLIFGIALALTRCRTAWIAASCASVAVVALSAPSLRLRRAIGAAIVVGGALLATVLPARLAWGEAHPFESTLSRAFDLGGGSGELRVRQYRATIAMLGDHDAWWTGIGAGGWQSAVLPIDPRATLNRIPHSDYARAAADGGIPALATLCVLLLAGAAAAWRRRREAPDLAVFVGVLALIALADAPLFRPEVIVVTGAMLAALQREPQARARACSLQPAVEAA